MITKIQKMTEILMMTLTPQLRKIAIKKRASHPSSIREPDLDFRKLVDKVEQAEITMKLEETANLKLKYINHIETNATHINNIQESDIDLSEKITEILNIYEKNPKYKVKPSFKKWCNYCRRYGQGISEKRQKQQDNQKNQISHFINTRKKFKTYQTRIYTVLIDLENHFQATQIILEINHHITLVIERDHPNREIHEISQKTDIIDRIVKTTIHNRIQTQQILFLHPVPNQTQKIDTIPTTDHEIHHTIEIETIQTIGIEITQKI